MFQRLTSLFFSNPPPPEDLDCPQAFVPEEEEVDGWLIIDLPGSWRRSAWSPGPCTMQLPLSQRGLLCWRRRARYGDCSGPVSGQSVPR
ncbi:tumor protein p53 inducible nuclear protein 2 [Phyllostomus discolor]|uniref:Tumor protein p53 inducible nuclear protein 2 n=1 Tax=Phyllostomus discolor TaxID=89673 RepID=A0A833ZBN3_9CHIR|nr:tumor protein p53 inducible nuclear protein 2 [Phyllostomus discolor]